MADQTNQGPQVLEPEFYGDPDEEGRVVNNSDLGALVQLNTAEINQQIVTARAYPRSITGFRRQMRELATLDQEVAKSCLYALKRGNKMIEGPSARFAEIAASAWGNCRAGARVIDIGDEYITAQGAFYDLEKNVAVSYEVLRRITDKDGQRYNADMISVTGNAACSIAIRNAVLKGIPKAIWNDAYLQARMVSVGQGEPMEVKRRKVFEAFNLFGVTPDQIFALLGIKGEEDLTVDHLIFLGGLHTSIKEGDTTIEEAFAAENSLTPGQAIPPRPRKSEFTRKSDTTTKPTETKTFKQTEPRPAAEKQTEQQNTAVAGGGEKPKDEPAPQQQAAAAAAQQDGDQEEGEPQVSVEAELESEYQDALKELSECQAIGKVTDLRERVMPIITTKEREREWITACEGRQQAILEASRKARSHKK